MLRVDWLTGCGWIDAYWKAAAQDTAYSGLRLTHRTRPADSIVKGDE